jgi:opacity protein-like surface antigen
MRKRIVCAALLAVLLATPALAQQVRVNGNRTPLRAEPTSTSTALAFYQAGSALDVIDFKDGWYKVRDPQTKQEGYILATLVDLLPATAPPRSAGTSASPTAAQPSPEPVSPIQARAPTKPTPPAGSGSPQTAVKKPTTAPHRWADRGFVAIDGLYQAGAPSLTDSFSYPKDQEQVTVTTDYPATKGPAFGGGGAIRLWRNLALGVFITVASRSSAGTANATIPHPFVFNAARTIAGSVPLERSENAVHLHALWAIPASKRLLIMVGGGPSVFSVKETLVDGVKYTETYPYDKATFDSASVTDSSASSVGYGVTVDVGYYFTRSIGVGGVVRYSHASVSLAAHQSTVSVDAGGFEAGLGVRFRFGAPKQTPPKPPAPTKPGKR